MGAPASVDAASRAGGPDWPAYGADLGNSRSQPRAGDINVGSVGRLGVAWAARDRGLDAQGNPGFVTSTPAVDGGLAVWADWRGDVHAVDVSSGRVRWVTHIAGPAYFEQINSSPTIVGRRVFVSTGTGTVVALDRATGKQLWSTVVDDAPDTDLFSSPVVVGSTVVIGVASVQLAFALNPYTFYGNVVALDARSGRIRWRTWVQRPGFDGPGGSVWSSAAVDPALGLLYIGTGQAYEAPAGPSTDSLLALRLLDGRVRWRRQFTSGDIFNFFDQSKGRDYDIGASPNLFDINGQRVVGVGDKGGHYEVFDARTGKPVWRRRLCAGSHLGGVMTTAAVADGLIWATCNRLRDRSELAEPTNRTDRDEPRFGDRAHAMDQNGPGRNRGRRHRGGRRGVRPQHPRHGPSVRSANRPAALAGAPRGSRTSLRSRRCQRNHGRGRSSARSLRVHVHLKARLPDRRRRWTRRLPRLPTRAMNARNRRPPAVPPLEPRRR